MRTVTRMGQFKRDLKRELTGIHGKTLAADLLPVLEALATDQPLDQRYSDHQLTGKKKDFRDCHIHPDLVLLYRKEGDSDTGILQLVRLGSHSEIF
jgi:mRNA interferase YafQ